MSRNSMHAEFDGRHEVIPLALFVNLKINRVEEYRQFTPQSHVPLDSATKKKFNILKHL